ncbi:hypothetical protein [[Acholeplasma] multilocale]|uniref:hypothetical protein n=1 Tax=[Acholeplasma] multilocale TaxID=264638 RepID=UPI0004107157|nr:hypothetical protein [[Acholeplasma] multilocale]
MKIIRTNIKDLQKLETEKNSIATIGIFDGFHLYHQKLLDIAKEHAVNEDLNFIVITFSKKVIDFFNDCDLSLINYDDKYDYLMKQYPEVTHFIEIETDQDLVNTTKEEFANILKDELNVVKLVEGQDFKFGSKASGNVEYLKEVFGEENVIIEPRHEEVSSSIIKSLISNGGMLDANRMLGIPFNVGVEKLDNNQYQIIKPLIDIKPGKYSAVLDGFLMTSVIIDKDRKVSFVKEDTLKDEVVKKIKLNGYIDEIQK